VDLVIVRENTEDLYAGVEHTVIPGVVESLKIITDAASTRIARFAFEHARREKRKRVTAVHKANIMKRYLHGARRVAKDYPEIQHDERIVMPPACSWCSPEKFDAAAAEPYGDAGSCRTGRRPGVVRRQPLADGGWFSVRRAPFGDINPLALLLSGVLMLRHLNEDQAADRVMRGVTTVLAGATRTRDIGGTASTTEFADAICRAMEADTQ
jgi:isocitrate dehydrogenase (NAD+)